MTTTLDNQDLVRELSKKDNAELASLIQESQQQRPRQQPATPSEYVLQPENGVDFVADHGPACWSEDRNLFITQDGWSLRPFHRGNPHVGQAFAVPQSLDRFRAIVREWHELRIEEAQDAIDEFKEKLVAELNATGRRVSEADVDETVRLQDELDARQAAYDEFMQPEREAAEEAQRYQAQEIQAQVRRGQKHQRNVNKVEKLFNEVTARRQKAQEEPANAE